MGKFRRDDRSGGSRFGNRDFRDRRSDRVMYKAICDNCGKDCEVPFQPSSDKPIYCSDCFKKRLDSQRRDFPKRESSSPSREQLDTLNSKLDRILTLLENRPSPKEKTLTQKAPKTKEKKISSKKKTTSKKK